MGGIAGLARRSALTGGKLAHERGQRLAPLDAHGVVDRSANAADRAVRTVLVDGEVVLQDGEPVHLDPKAAMEKVADAQARMIRDTPKIDYAQRPGDAISPLSLEIH